MPKTVRRINNKNKLSYAAGTFFGQGHEDLYILAQVEGGVHKLISLHGGNRYTDEPMTDETIRKNGFKKIQVEVEVQ